VSATVRSGGAAAEQAAGRKIAKYDLLAVSTNRSRDTWPGESVIDRFLFGAGPQDSVYFRRQPRAQLSFPAHFNHYSELYLDLAPQQFL